MTRAHVVIRLNRTASTPYTLALLALIQPVFPLLRSPNALWLEARSKLTEDSPTTLRTVLSLPFEEAERCLSLLPPTPSPITAIAEQVTLVHLNDLLSTLFVRLVRSSTSSRATSVQELMSNLSASSIATDLKGFDNEIRKVVGGVAKGTSAHALGLVLIGLWGILTGATPAAQLSLASALTAEELQGVGSGFASVQGMLSLLKPDVPRQPARKVNLPENAMAIDKLALVCINLIRLISSAAELNDRQSRLERLEASKTVGKAVTELRAILTQTTFTGLGDIDGDSADLDVDADAKPEIIVEVSDCAIEDDDEAEESARMGKNGQFELARETLVGVLSVVGRKAAGRAMGRDDDSGLEGDLDEL